jgi:hypothetical protein
VGNEVDASRSEVQGEEPWGASAHACDYIKKRVIGLPRACDYIKKTRELLCLRLYENTRYRNFAGLRLKKSW